MRWVNVNADVGERREVERAIEARIRIQLVPLEIALQIDLNVPHLVLDQPVAIRKALSTSAASEWLSSADLAHVMSQVAFRRKRARTILARISNHQMRRIDVTLKIRCSSVGFRALITLKSFCYCCCCRVCWRSWNLSLLLQEIVVVVHQSKLMLFRFFVFS